MRDGRQYVNVEGAVDERSTINSTAASLLGFLHEGPLTGWQLVQEAQRKVGDFWSLTPSQVYRELQSMAVQGLVEAGERGTRERRPFTITDAGRRSFGEWLERGPGTESIRFPLLLTVLFGTHLPAGRLASTLHHQRAIHAARLAGYESVNTNDARAPRTVYEQATLDFGIAYERAVLSWFDRLPRELKRG